MGHKPWIMEDCGASAQVSSCIKAAWPQRFPRAAPDTPLALCSLPALLSLTLTRSDWVRAGAEENPCLWQIFDDVIFARLETEANVDICVTSAQSGCQSLSSLIPAFPPISSFSSTFHRAWWKWKNTLMLISNNGISLLLSTFEKTLWHLNVITALPRGCSKACKTSRCWKWIEKYKEKKTNLNANSLPSVSCANTTCFQGEKIKQEGSWCSFLSEPAEEPWGRSSRR